MVSGLALPYSPEFDRLKGSYQRQVNRPVSDSEFWRILKEGREVAGRTRRPEAKGAIERALLVTREQQLELHRLMPDGLGHRDQFPYTPALDDLLRRYSRLTKTRLTKHEFWRVLSQVSKKARKLQPLFDSAPLGGLSEDVVRLLERQNPWWRGEPQKPVPSFRRRVCGEVMRRLYSNATAIVAVRGPRQVGKTTVQEQLIEELLRLRHVSPARILRVQFDDVPTLGNFTDPILALVDWYEKNVLGVSLNTAAQKGEPAYLFFDEVQNLRTWAPY